MNKCLAARQPAEKKKQVKMFDGLGGKLLDESDRIKVDGYIVE